MKRMEVTEKKIGENTFYLKPFPAFAAVNISGELTSVLLPALGGIAKMMGTSEGTVKEKAASIMEMEVDEAIPVLTESLSGISGNSVERLMRKLLVDSGNISVQCEATNGSVKVLDKELADEVFCGDIQDMFILAFEVIRLNFSGFFEKVGALFGNQEGDQEGTPSTAASAT